MKVFTRSFLFVVSLVAASAAAHASPSTIIGGVNANEEAWPWIVSLSDSRGNHFCGGALIHPEIVVTAAHCLTNMSARNIVARVGLEQQNAAGSADITQVSAILSHPNYSSRSSDNDIALVQLSEPSSKPIVRLITDEVEGSLIPGGTTVRVQGWGAMDSQGYQYPNQLQSVDVEMVDFNECNSRSRYNGVLSQNMICAGDIYGEQDSCYGDSGGPLAVYANGEWVLSGVVSWGYECANAQFPGVYARVSRYIDWISEYLPIEVADNDWLSETVDNGDTDVPGNGGQPDAGGGSTGPDDTTTPDDSGSTVDDGAGSGGSDSGATTGGDVPTDAGDSVNDDGFIQDFTDLSPGGDCDGGGVQVDSGYDVNGDGALSGDEVLGSDTYCYDVKSAAEGCQGAPMPLPWVLGIMGLAAAKVRRRRFGLKM
ncbi:MAG: serine protease [Myxococcota bacterium]|nr:serine protease [Myxococcota bacterium]